MSSSNKAGSFETPHFAEGRFRLAYKGRWTVHPSKVGQQLVLKKMKDRYSGNPSDWDTTVKIYTKASELAQSFNEYSKTDHPVSFTGVDVVFVSCLFDQSAVPKIGEYVVVEDYIEGEYKKWCNNYGYLSTESQSMPAFMHWSWVHTKGQLMIADLQGVRGDDRFSLTDPVIMSVDNSYGPTDTGVEGMIMFFQKHECNKFCRNLPKPKLSDFVGEIPTPLLDACKQMLLSCNNSTTYKFELKFDAQTKTKVATILQQVASRHFQATSPQKSHEHAQPAVNPSPRQPAVNPTPRQAHKRAHSTPESSSPIINKRTRQSY